MNVDLHPEWRRPTRFSGKGRGASARRRWSGVCGLTLLLLWTVVHVLAAVPQLHHVFHADATETAHECLLTKVASGGVEPVTPLADVVVAAPVFVSRVSCPSIAPTLPTLHEPCAARPPPAWLQSFPQAGS